MYGKQPRFVVSHYLNERETFDFAGLKYEQHPKMLFPRTLECVFWYLNHLFINKDIT